MTSVLLGVCFCVEQNEKSEQKQLFTQSRSKLQPRSQGHLSTFTAQENAGNNLRTIIF
jgi:hypothetical protein